MWNLVSDSLKLSLHGQLLFFCIGNCVIKKTSFDRSWLFLAGSFYTVFYSGVERNHFSTQLEGL
jgi:hypothetical protein